MYENSDKAQCIGVAQGVGYGYGSRISGESVMQAQTTAFTGGSIKQDPRGTLESAIDSVTIGTGEAFTALDRLAERLHLVLQQEMPSPTGVAGNACSSPPTSPAVSRLHGLRDQLEVLTARLHTLRCRLDT